MSIHLIATVHSNGSSVYKRLADVSADSFHLDLKVTVLILPHRQLNNHI